MRFAAVANATCATPETCGNGNLMVAGLQVQRDPAIICLRLRPLNKNGGQGGDGSTGLLSTAGIHPEYDGALVEGASVEEKMSVLEKFAFRNEYQTFADAVEEL